MITGDTITDEQIRELRRALMQEDPPFHAYTDQALAEALLACHRALATSAVRARCAEILNARAVRK